MQLIAATPERHMPTPTLLLQIKKQPYKQPKTNWHNKVVHALARTLLAQPKTRCFTLINVGKPLVAIQTTLYPHGCCHTHFTYQR